MDATPSDVTVFRSSRGMTAVYVGLGLIPLTLAWASLTADVVDGTLLCFGTVTFSVGLLLIWSAIHFATKTETLTPSGFTVTAMFRTRRYAWPHLERWGVTTTEGDGSGQRVVWFKFARRFFSVTFHEFELARPGFDRFLELVRRHVGDKERPRPPSNV